MLSARTIFNRSFSLNTSRNGLIRSYYKVTAQDLIPKSCYHGVNFVISKDDSVYDAIKRMAGINLGCLAVSDAQGNFAGVVTERDYMKKVELQGLTAKKALVSEIMTSRARLNCARDDDTTTQLMTKMMSSDVRHLPVLNKNNDLIGMLSIKDIVREVNKEHDEDINTLSSFALGKGGHFVLD